MCGDMKNMVKIVFSIVFGCFVFLSFGQQKNWTIMYYAAGSNSSEIDLLNDVKDIRDNKTSSDYEIVMLIDRIEGYSDDSSALGQNFTDTKLFRFNDGDYMELNGNTILPNIRVDSQFDANMGDADLLKNFIKYCKNYYPAKNYMLIMRSHGNGQNMCPEEELDSGLEDAIFPQEMRDVLTQNESVDVLGLDVCSMAGLENFYEWRPSDTSFSADYIIASAPLSGAWPYKEILSRIVDGSVNSGIVERRSYDSKVITAKEWCKVVIEELKDNQRWASWGIFDNSKIVDLKEKIDRLSAELVNEDKSEIKNILESSLKYHHNVSNDDEVAQLAMPYVDSYDFFKRVCNHKKFNTKTKNLALQVCNAIDELTMDSFYGNGFLPETSSFEDGKSGAYLIFPSGDRQFSKSGKSFWSHMGWFHPMDRTGEGKESYGNYDWCYNGAVPNNGKVENLFELLEYLFDNQDRAGGVNNYNY